MPACWPRTISPASIASAPAPVTSSAWRAAARARGLVVVVADQQERRDRRQLPEPVEDEHVVGEDEAGHRPGEEHEQAEQANVARRRVGEVARRVGDDEHADAGDQHQHQGGEAVEAEGEVDAELGDPLDGLGQHVAVDDVGAVGRRARPASPAAGPGEEEQAGGDRRAGSSLPSGRRRRPGGGRAAGPSSRRTLGRQGDCAGGPWEKQRGPPPKGWASLTAAWRSTGEENSLEAVRWTVVTRTTASDQRLCRPAALDRANGQGRARRPQVPPRRRLPAALPPQTPA